mgnify:CR=1 FL=1
MNKKVLIPVGIGVGVGLLALALSSKKSSPVVVDTAATGADQTALPAPTLDLSKILAKGSTGLEVKELQRLMSITADGVFGSQTEARLFALKGVKSTSLSRYKTLPNINQNIYPVGTKVMSNIDFNTDTKLYQALQKADGTYVATDFIGTTVSYGEEIGTVIGVNGTGSWYLIYRDSFWTGGHYFVKAAEIKKI